MISKKVILVFLILFSLKFYSQEVELDTIQKYRKNKLFSLKIAKNDDTYQVNLTNLSRKDFYIIESDFRETFRDYKHEIFQIGKTSNELGDGKYYYATKIGVKESLTVEFVRNSNYLPLKIEITYTPKKRLRKKDDYSIKKYVYHKIKKTYIYIIPTALQQAE